MKTFWKRLLAISLSAALLIGCAVSGLVLPVAADPVTDTGVNLITDGNLESKTGGSYDATAGYGGGVAYRVAGKDGGNASGTMPTLNLSKQLEEGKLYVVRFKVKGGRGGTWNNFINNSDIPVAYMGIAGSDWAMAQMLFTPTSTELNKTTFTLGALYNKTQVANTYVYYDDFELYEYYAGMNLMPASNCDIVPSPTARGTASNDWLMNYISAGTTLSSVNDGGNQVLKLSNVPLDVYAGTRLNVGFINSNPIGGVYPCNLLTKGREITISLRFKSAVAGQNASFQILVPDTNYGTVVGGDIDAVVTDSETWKTVTTKIVVAPGSKDPLVGYTASFKHSGASDILIDDIFFGETVEAQIEEEAVTVEEGKTVTLTAAATPAGTPIAWTSSDNTIATVDGGVVTALKPGKVTITATAQNGWSDTCEVTVAAKPEVNITKTTASVEIGSSITLDYTVAPAGSAVTWTSSSDAIATVENGVVKAVSKGTVTITAKLTDEVYDTCEVTVTSIAPGTNLLINGDFEGDEWTGSNFTTLEGYDGGKVLSLTSSWYQFPSSSLKLKEPLDPEKTYVFRFKAKGGLPRIWAQGTPVFMNMTPAGNNVTKGLISADDWVEIRSALFKPGKAVSDLPSGDGSPLAWIKAEFLAPNSENVYCDDFEIFEYVPGSNLFPGSNGEMLPLTYATGASTPFLDLFAYGATITLDNDNGNAVWKLGNLNAMMTNQPNGPILRTDFLADHGVLVAGDTGRYTFRYKGDATITVTSGNKSIVAHEDIICKITDETDGWKKVTIDFTFTTVNHNGGLRIKINGADSILMDDMTLVKVVEEPIEDFSIEMLGLGIHWPNGVEATQANADGVRFGARLYFGEGFPTINEETGMLQLPYGGEYCDVVSVGTLLRRHADGDLTVANATWKSEAYSSTTNKFKCIVKTDTYLDFAVNMMAGENVLTEVFNARNYDARGYVQLSNGEIIYTGVVTNGIDAYFATQQ